MTEPHPIQPEDPAVDRRAGVPGPPLFTFRITRLLDLLRRSGTLANRREFGVSGIEWQVMSHVGTRGPRLRRDTLRAAWSDRVTVEFARWGSTYGRLYGEGEA